MGTLTVSPTRVRTLILNALELFSKGSTDGKFWVQGTEVTGSPIVGTRYGYCSIGAIRHVPGFNDQEIRAAEIALAKMIERDLGYSGFSDEDLNEAPELAEEVIVEANDSDGTTFTDVRGWFTAAAAFLKKK